MQLERGERDTSTRLSRLQKQILVLALDNKLRKDQGLLDRGDTDLYYCEILVRIFGLPIKQWYHPSHTASGGRTVIGSRMFDPEKIGRRRYNCVHAAVSRAVLRLETRNLVCIAKSMYSIWTGCNLTPVGAEIASKLAEAVKSLATVAQDLTASEEKIS